MKNHQFIFALTFFFFSFLLNGFSQGATYEQQNFCKNLNKVFELGRKDNFDSYDGTMVKQSALLPVPGYSIKLDLFPVTYTDKDHRFVGKTNENLDSLSALNKLEELKNQVGFCLDSTQWKPWIKVLGDDVSTVFFREFAEEKTSAKDLTLSIAIVTLAPKLYSINFYVKRK